MVDPLVLAVPAFLLLAGIEAAVLVRRPGAGYRLGDLVSGIGCGALDQVINLAVVAGFLGLYAWIHRHWSIAEVSAGSVFGWIGCVLVHDLAYYLFHRASHRVNFLWAAHALHHQSEGYTLAVSLRQGAIATWIVYWFYLPMALFFPLGMFVVVHGVYQIYQFTVHTRLIPSLGPLEKVLATPMLHRVHHGRDPDCLDKNYGGFFIWWDMLLGSYAPYQREPDYGVTTGIRSWSPFWANLHPYSDLARRVRRAPSWRDRIRMLVRPPEWAPPWDIRDQAPHGYGPPVAAPIAIYGLVQLGFTVAASLALMWPAPVGDVVQVGLVGFVLSSLVTIAALFDRRAWAGRAETVRLAAFAIAAAALAATGALPAAPAVAIAAAAGLSLALRPR
jgi:alkylglycerol monooxygenase